MILAVIGAARRSPGCLNQERSGAGAGAPRTACTTWLVATTSSESAWTRVGVSVDGHVIRPVKRDRRHCTHAPMRPVGSRLASSRHPHSDGVQCTTRRGVVAPHNAGMAPVEGGLIRHLEPTQLARPHF